jgi:hypothetical protein
LLFLHKYTIFCEVVKHGIVVTAQRAHFLSGTSKVRAVFPRDDQPATGGDLFLGR